MNKPIRYIIGCLIYLVLFSICAPYSYVAYSIGNYELMYSNGAASALMAVMFVVNIFDLIKCLISQEKGE